MFTPFTVSQFDYGSSMADMLLNPSVETKKKFLKSGKQLTQAAQSISEQERLEMLRRDAELKG